MERNKKSGMDTGTNQKDRQELVKSLKDRLKWFTFEAGDEEFDSEEVTAIVNLLNVLDPMEDSEYFSAEKALERFWKYYEQREYVESVLINKPAEDGRSTFRGRNAFRGRNTFQGKNAYKGNVVTDFEPAVSVLAEFETQESALAGSEMTESELAGFETIESELAGAEPTEFKPVESELTRAEPTEFMLAESELVGSEPAAFEPIESELAGVEKSGQIVSVTRMQGDKENRYYFRGKQFFRTHKVITSVAAAAVLVVMVFAVFNVGALAERETGFFYWLRKGDGGTEFVTTGDMGMNEEYDVVIQFENMDVVPVEYKEKLWMPTTSELPAGMEFLYVEVAEAAKFTKITERFVVPDSDLELQIGSMLFPYGISIQSLDLDEFRYIGERILNNVSMDLYSIEKDGEIQYAVCFYDNDTQYFVKGNLELDEIINIASDYAQNMLKE